MSGAMNFFEHQEMARKNIYDSLVGLIHTRDFCAWSALTGLVVCDPSSGAKETAWKDRSTSNLS